VFLAKARTKEEQPDPARPDGSEERCTVWIDVAFFFEGAMTVDRKTVW